MTYGGIWFLALLITCGLARESVAQTKVFAGITPGVQYIEKDKEAGPAVDLLKFLFAEAGLEYQFVISNWAKAHQSFNQTPQSLLFSIARYQGRENQYQWLLDVGPLDLRIARSKHRPDLNPVTLQQLKNYKLAVVRGSTPHKLLLDSGFAEDQDFGTVPAADELMKYMGTGFVEFVFYESTISPMMLKLNNYPADYLVPTDIELPVDSHLWLVASLDFPEPLRNHIMRTHLRLLSDAKYQNLRKAVLPLSRP